jgi:hypothetical protein
LQVIASTILTGFTQVGLIPVPSVTGLKTQIAGGEMEECSAIPIFTRIKRFPAMCIGEPTKVGRGADTSLKQRNRNRVQKKFEKKARKSLSTLTMEVKTWLK